MKITAQEIILDYLKENGCFYTHEYEREIKAMAKRKGVTHTGETWMREFRRVKANKDLLLSNYILFIKKDKEKNHPDYYWTVIREN